MNYGEDEVDMIWNRGLVAQRVEFRKDEEGKFSWRRLLVS